MASAAHERDTFSQLPLITRPMPALARETSSGQLGAQTLPTQPSGSGEGALWARWGAARAGARVVLAPGQRLTLELLVLTALALLLVSDRVLGIVLVGLVTVFYLGAGVYKFTLLLRGERVLAVTAPPPRPLADDELPAYTVLVPLFHEGKLLPLLISRLRTLDYPRDRLDILLLVEEDDAETLSALEHCALPRYVRPVMVPNGPPRTKPRALNVGLAWTQGQYVVIYDAEDRPEPDQLRKAAAAFNALPRRVACLQARLNFYNRHQSLLTRLFSVDYAIWYDMLLPGLVGKRAFVPLGGTSNHFRVEVLRRLGGWDPYNVTEDADLGARLARARLEIRMLNSVTWEEAVAHASQWTRQRSRWVKGYLQTYLVHMRHPLRLLREIGLRAFLDFQLVMGGSSLILLLNPIMWGLTVSYFLTKGTPISALIESVYPTPLYYPALLCLLGNFAFFYMQLYICVRRGYADLARYALLGPFYWLLMSVGAWVGLVSLVRAPYYWEKTSHGVSLEAKKPLPAHLRAALPAALAAGGHLIIATVRFSSLAARALSRAIRTRSPRVRRAAPVAEAFYATRDAVGALDFNVVATIDLPTRFPLMRYSLSVILPAHNEEAIIAETLHHVVETLDAWALDFEVIVVNDGSTDRTRSIVEARALADDRICLINHPINQGYGTALANGFASVTKDLAFFMDSDGQFDIRDLRQFIPLIGRYDGVLGYRIDRQDTWIRRLNALGWKLLVSTMFGVRVRDVDCAFKLFRADFFRTHRLESRGAMINAEILFKMKRAGYTVAQVGVRHLPRQGGAATGAKPAVIARAFQELALFTWRWHVTSRHELPT
jgi:cellulose synthase/poly-beta-1,6-N-acetylglucosamine synthase-like glycosyltransferase